MGLRTVHSGQRGRNESGGVVCGWIVGVETGGGLEVGSDRWDIESCPLNQPASISKGQSEVFGEEPCVKRAGETG